MLCVKNNVLFSIRILVYESVDQPCLDHKSNHPSLCTLKDFVATKTQVCFELDIFWCLVSENQMYLTLRLRLRNELRSSNQRVSRVSIVRYEKKPLADTPWLF